jgi:hypothetical protein
MADRPYRYDTLLTALSALVVQPDYVETAARLHDRTRKVRIAFTHAADKHAGTMVGWIVQRQSSGEYRVLSTPGGKPRKLPAHIWRVDGVGPNPIPFYVCPALRKEAA